MKTSALEKRIGDLGTLASEAPFKLGQSELNEQWTKKYLVTPLLEVLGWDDPYEVLLEDSPSDVEDAVDYLLKPDAPDAPRLCVEAKALMTQAPQDQDKAQIKKGLEQSKRRNASYFIWTNGNVWQVFAVEHLNAPVYEIRLNEATESDTELRATSERLSVLSRDNLVDNPDSIREAILAYWRQMAFPEAFRELRKRFAQEMTALMRKALPQELDVPQEEILEFLETCTPAGTAKLLRPRTQSKPPTFVPCPENWGKLVRSLEPKYENARKNLLKDPNRRLGEYLLSNEYAPWPRTVTFSLLGQRTRGSHTKGITAQAVTCYRKYGFIEQQDPEAKNDAVTYQRVEAAMDVLKQLMELRR